VYDSILFVVGAYLLGALPHLYLLGRLRGLYLKGDLHMELWSKGGRLLGTVGFFGDLAKGITVVLIGNSLELEIATMAIAGLAVVSGQMWTIFSKFDGEKGNSVAIAMAATLTPQSFWIASIPMAIGFLIRTMPRMLKSGQPFNEKLKLGGPPSLSLPLGMFIGFLVLPVVSWWLDEPLVVSVCYFLLFVLIIIRRITADLGEDLGKGENIRIILLNRILYDRSEVNK
jgi:glycerol-3-phosphate acyltransferase PlsY